ncbi:GTPases ISS related protein [Babesia ovis]|uniref:GTPases ISS related protein n=1 Tax=Babesia ovis TaxID=5869 RepID=A0A9W5TBU4_BABOV|nr:GTPases ISS related protein [Babesia ovis]
MRWSRLQRLVATLPTAVVRLQQRQQLCKYSVGARNNGKNIAQPVKGASKPSLSEFGLDTYDDTLLPGITADPFFKELNLPKRCIGCGALFQSTDVNKPGYVDSDVLSSFGARGAAKVPRIGGIEVERVPDGVQVDRCDDGRLQRLKRRAVCRRCYKLQNYKRVEPLEDIGGGDAEMDMDNNPRRSTARVVHSRSKTTSGVMKMPEEAERERAASSARRATAPELISNMVRRIKSEGLVLYLVDITNIEATALPELYIALRNKSMEVIWIVNKVDVLPHKTDLPEIKRWIRSMVRHIGNAKNSDVFMVSSTKGIGFDALEKRLKESVKLGSARDIYVVGAVNAGKSTFVNRFLHFINYSDAGTLQMKRGIGGATRSVTPGTTLEFIEFGLFGGFKLIDTPGIPLGSTIIQLLKRPVDMVSISMNKTIQPVVIRLDPGQSLLLGALARIDMIQGNAANVYCYLGPGVTLQTCRTVAATDIMNHKAGVKLFPPHSKDDYERIQPLVKYRVTVNCNGPLPVDDLVISGFGWVSITGIGPKVIEIHAPKGLDVLSLIQKACHDQESQQTRTKYTCTPSKRTAEKTYENAAGNARVEHVTSTSGRRNKNVSKPLASYLKKKASRNEGFRKLCVSIGNRSYAFDRYITRRFYNAEQGEPDTTPWISPEKSVVIGTELFGEIIVFGVATLLVLSEYARGVRKEAKKEARLQGRLNALETQHSKIEFIIKDEVQRQLERKWSELEARMKSSPKTG